MRVRTIRVVVLLTVLTAGIAAGAPQPAFAATGELTISSMTFDRSATTGDADWSAHVDASSLSWGDSCPTYNCKLTLVAKDSSGGNYFLADANLLSMGSSSYDFSGQFQHWNRIVGLVASWGSLSSSLSPVSDSLLAQSLTLSSWSGARDQSTGVFNWQATIHVSALPNCGYGCHLSLIAEAVPSGAYELSAPNIPNNYVSDIPISGSFSSPIELSSVRLKYGSVESASTAISDTLRSKGMYVLLDRSEVASGDLQWGLTVIVSALDLDYSDCPTYNCQINIVGQDANGGTVVLASKPLLSKYYSRFDVSGSYTGSAPLVKVRATYGSFSSSWVDVPSQQVVGGHDYADASMQLVALTAGVQPSAACSLIFPLGTHASESSLTDQDLACKALILGGFTLVEAVTKVLKDGGLSYTLKLMMTLLTVAAQATRDKAIDYGTELPSGCTYSGLYQVPCVQNGTTTVHTPWSAPVPIDGVSEANATEIAESQVEETPPVDEDPVPVPFALATADERKKFSQRVCQKQLDLADPTTGLSLSEISGISSDECKEMPVFISGGGVPREASQHDLSAVLNGHPEWLILRAAHVSEKLADVAIGLAPQKPTGTSALACGPTYNTTVQQCDEFPFYATEQGYPAGFPDYSPIAIAANTSQGSMVGHFYTECFPKNLVPRNTAERDYLFVPVPDDNVPTYYYCDK